VEIRTDSREALELFKKRHAEFDLVITDMTMPHMSGDKLARKMLEVAPRMPIILCTGFSVEVSELRLAHVGIKAVAMKPLVRNELARLIRQVLDADTG
jgi:CheY-like chemotaxis protein